MTIAGNESALRSKSPANMMTSVIQSVKTGEMAFSAAAVTCVRPSSGSKLAVLLLLLLQHGASELLPGRSNRHLHWITGNQLTACVNDRSVLCNPDVLGLDMMCSVTGFHVL